MDDKKLDNFITLTDENGENLDFEILDYLEKDGRCFYALLPRFELDLAKSEEENYFIFERKKLDDLADDNFEEVSDENLLDELSSIFEQRFEEEFS